MSKNRIVLQVPPNHLWNSIDINKVKKTGWEIKTGSDKIVRHMATVPIFGTREMWKAIKAGDFLVLIESSVDDLHQYAWNLHVMSEEFYKKWEANE